MPSKPRQFIVIGNCNQFRQIRTFDLTPDHLRNVASFLDRYQSHLAGTWKIYKLQTTFNRSYEFADNLIDKLRGEDEEGFVSIGEQILTKEVIHALQNG